ncbi:MAG: hypothetical protein QOI46_2366 [Alphaproteobacteria bacterium]|jgi:hypothetical protein|nr:hypothetical protein [Alphaproteobacteria bacterium]
MLRKTIIVLATAAALTGGLTADAVALATAHTGWDGLGAVGHAIATSPSNVIKLYRARPANGTTCGRVNCSPMCTLKSECPVVRRQRF